VLDYLNATARMMIHQKPKADAVIRLLAEAGLPTSDLQPAMLEWFFGYGDRDTPSGIIGLEIAGDDALLRSLVVREGARGEGIGDAMVDAVERAARSMDIQDLYLLTETAASFFARLGYVAIARDRAPDAIKNTTEFSSLCSHDAILMVKHVGAGGE